MFLIHGIYHWQAKSVAFRNDYCISCGDERVAIQVRTLDVLHLFWIPVLPLGAYRRWRCMTCGQPPHMSRTARQSVKILLAILLTIIASSFWLLPTTPPEDEEFVWLLRLGSMVPAIAVWWWVSRGSDDVERRRRLPQILPNQASECPVCDVPLLLLDPASCPECGIVRTRVNV